VARASSRVAVEDEGVVAGGNVTGGGGETEADHMPGCEAVARGCC